MHAIVHFFFLLLCLLSLNSTVSNASITIYNTVQPRLSKLEMQRKVRVKVHIVTTWPDYACAVNPFASLPRENQLLHCTAIKSTSQRSNGKRSIKFDLVGVVNIFRTSCLSERFSLAKGVRIIEVGLSSKISSGSFQHWLPLYRIDIVLISNLSIVRERCFIQARAAGSCMVQGRFNTVSIPIRESISGCIPTYLFRVCTVSDTSAWSAIFTLYLKALCHDISGDCY